MAEAAPPPSEASMPVNIATTNNPNSVVAVTRTTAPRHGGAPTAASHQPPLSFSSAAAHPRN
jgi:hypothetical protein